MCKIKRHAEKEKVSALTSSSAESISIASSSAPLSPDTVEVSMMLVVVDNDPDPCWPSSTMGERSALLELTLEVRSCVNAGPDVSGESTLMMSVSLITTLTLGWKKKKYFQIQIQIYFGIASAKHI